MDEAKARKILAEHIQPDNSLEGGICFVSWPHHGDSRTICLDGDFDAEDLDALAWWMRHASQERRSCSGGE